MKKFLKRGLGGGKRTSAAIDNKKGLYLTTDYEIFTNPQWLKRIKEVVSGKNIDDTEAFQIVQGVKNHVRNTNKKI